MPHLIVSKLRQDNDVRTPSIAGQWDLQESKVFGDIASSLDYKAPGKSRTVSSVPTMWSRPLLMEMSLHNPKYPIREEMIEQWQGMLAAIALAETRSFPITAKYLNLEELNSQHKFARALYELCPDPTNILYGLDGHNPWQEIYVFLWNDRPVGMTSPSTIVVTSEDGQWGKELPWYDATLRRLKNPHNYLNKQEKIALRGWLRNLTNELNNHQGQPNAVNMIRGLLEQFRDSLGQHVDRPLTLTDNLSFFSEQINRGVLKALNRPIKTEHQESMVRLIISDSKKQGNRPLIIIDKEIATNWGIAAHNVWVHEDKTLASVSAEELKVRPWTNAGWIESKDLFLPKLSFINAEDALPGALLPTITPSLNFNGREITPLLPISSRLLGQFTPEDLINKKIIQLNQLSNHEGVMLRVTLNLPLSGIDNNEIEPTIYSVSRDYPIRQENAIVEVPVLEIWPHFEVENWHEYYALYHDVEAPDQTFNISIPGSQNPQVFKEGQGSYQIVKFGKFPSFIIAQDKNKTVIGLILLKTPPRIELTGKWTVGVDFGTSFTNIYTKRNDMVSPLQLENLLLKVTNVGNDVRLPVLLEYFVPETFIPTEKPLPLASVLTTRGRQGAANSSDNIRPIYDGRIYIPKDNQFPSQADYIETDLKWSNIVPNRLFIKHLILHITALAAKNGVCQIQWSLSYPSAFSIGDRQRYIQSWLNATRELEEKTGIRQICPTHTDTEFLRTESLAVAQYFNDEEGQHLVNSTCIDLGGGTSDISIWQNQDLLYQCSLKLAGRDLFSNILEANPVFLRQRFQLDWSQLRGGRFQAKLDTWLRRDSENWLRQKIDFVQGERDFQGLTRITALGISGLYYYIGLILKVLYAEGTYTNNRLTSIYMGGNGSRLLNWISMGGKFNQDPSVSLLLSRMFSKGSGFPDIQQPTILSQKPKDEVACGLVRGNTQLTGLLKGTTSYLIAGEDCEINGHIIIDYKDHMNIEEDINSFKVHELEQLEKFLHEFNLAVTSLNSEGLMITPLPKFRRQTGLDEAYSRQLWSAVNDELTNTLLAFRGPIDEVSLEPPFILGLKALIRVLTKEWARN